MTLIPPQFLDCVVAVGAETQNGEINWIASGFLFGWFLEKVNDEKNNYKLFFVTNKHVINGQRKILLRFNRISDEPAKQYEVELLDKKGIAKYHIHHKPEIDIAIIEINGNLLRNEGIQFDFFRSEANCANITSLISQETSEGDFVYVLGFPMGIIGDERNYVIVRSGILARIRDTIKRRQDTFLVDTLIFPGNSGGPVIIKPEVVSIRGTKPQNKAKLIGIVSGYIPYRDIAISQQSKKPRISFEENSGLASVYPVDFIEEIIKESMTSNQE